LAAERSEPVGAGPGREAQRPNSTNNRTAAVATDPTTVMGVRRRRPKSRRAAIVRLSRLAPFGGSMPIGSLPTAPAFRLSVSADVFSLLPRDVAVVLPLGSRCRFFHVVDVTVALPFGSPCGFIRVVRSLGAPLCATLLTASHRQSHEQNHEQHRERDNDHHDAGGNRDRYKRGADHASLLPRAAPSIYPRRSVATRSIYRISKAPRG
jgi:hypothetical protein